MSSKILRNRFASGFTLKVFFFQTGTKYRDKCVFFIINYFRGKFHKKSFSSLSKSDKHTSIVTNFQIYSISTNKVRHKTSTPSHSKVPSKW